MCSGLYANNMKCIHTSACGHIVDCNELIGDIYTDIVGSYLHMCQLVYVAIISLLRGTFVGDTYITIVW